MDNTKLPAYPLPIAINEKGEILDTADYEKSNAGFTKLELASLMAMQGMLSNSLTLDQGFQPLHTYTPQEMAKLCVSYAAAVLEEANK